MNPRHAAPDSTDALARGIASRPGVGIAAHVLQGRELEILRARVEQPALILVQRGIKTVRAERGAAVRARPGQAIVLAGNQTVDFANSVTEGQHYEARWLVFVDHDWSADCVARHLALSEATLRRRLAGEGTSLTQLLVDTRMATALMLLQATTQPVSDIALSVGYESPSRFAVRFRKRFGFAPTAVRGHERAF